MDPGIDLLFNNHVLPENSSLFQAKRLPNIFQTGGALIDPSWVIIDGPTFNELELYVLLLYKM